MSSSSVAAKRLPYIDVYKGILIILVVWSHLGNGLNKILPSPSEAIMCIDSMEMFWLPFFMPAFFVITGYCSNFNKKFKEYFLSNLKLLIIPAMITCLIVGWIYHVQHGEWGLSILRPSPSRLLLQGGGNWFLPALFVSKMIYYFVNKIASLKIQTVVVLLLSFFGVILFVEFPFVINVWFFKHGLVLLYALHLGAFLKGKNTSIAEKIGLLYIALWLVFFLFDLNIPFVSHRFEVSMLNYPLLLLFSVFGYFMFLFLSKCVYSNSILEYLGRNSIVIYLTQGILYSLLNPLFVAYFCGNFVIEILLGLLLIVINISIGCLISWFLNLRYLRWTLGKF